jgi:hypothetical protein
MNINNDRPISIAYTVEGDLPSISRTYLPYDSTVLGVIPKKNEITCMWLINIKLIINQH